MAGASDMPGALCGEFKDDCEVLYSGSRLTWKMSFAKLRSTRTAAAWNAWHMLGDFC